MRSQRIRRTILAGVGGLLVALGGMTLHTPPLAASDCGGEGEVKCASSELCLDFKIVSFCRSSYDYYAGE